ncbi:hypothetical protein Leryth_016111 [Lithospermum erythrorhizon]|nr:hypothetical protein Leryth_016111 [Lithospermum erythrorhizon]
MEIVDQECIKTNEQKEHSEDFESPYSSYASSLSRCNKVDGGNNLAHCQPFEIPLEKADIDDFWNILDSLEMSRESSNIFQSCTNGNGEARINKISSGDSEEEVQHQRWLKNLEYELGLEAENGANDNIMSLPDEYSIFDSQYQIF